MPAREILDRSSRLVDERLADQPLVRATLLDSIGDVYRSLAEFDKADRMLREALAIRVRLLGRDAPEVATSLIHLGWLLQERGQFDEAESLFNDALARRSARFGPDSPEAIEVKGRLGILWAFEEDTGRAEAAFREVIEKLGRLRGGDDRNVALARLGLAAALFDADRMLDAANEFGKAMLTLMKGPESEQLTLALKKYQAGYLMNKAGQFGPAERLFREGLEIFRGLFRPDHPYFAFYLHGIGRLEEARGRLAEAEASYRSGVDLLRRSVGFRHPKAKIAVGSLASLLARTGRAAEARGLAHELVEARLAGYGPDHAWVADALVVSAAVAERAGDGDAHRKLLREALAIYRKPRTHFFVGLAECLNNLGRRRLADGAHGEAEALLREAIPLVQKQHGARSFNAGIVKGNLARALTLQGKDEDETDRLFGEALGILRPAFGLASPEACPALTERADFERRRGRFDRAEAMAREAYEATRGGHPRAADCARVLAGVIADRGDARRAIPLLKEAVARDRAARPADANGPAFDRTLLALAYAASGDREGHRRVVSDLLEGWERRTMDDGLRWIAWAAARFPDTLNDPDRLAMLSARVVAAAPEDLANRLVGAAALLRAGRSEEAAGRFEQIRRERGSEYGYDSLFLAIAQANRGRADEARAALARAAAWIDGPGGKQGDWNDRLELSILRREAEALIAAPVLELPADVFAPDRE